MRIKCPNSDIFLDLPDGRMDMKFNCPSCNQVHRVTLTITTPGQSPTPFAPAVPGAAPKRYATGDYPPVVDVPIDADFVLVEKSADQTLDGSGGSGTAAFAAAEPPPLSSAPPDVELRFGQPLADVRTRRKQRGFATFVIVALLAAAGWFGYRWVTMEVARASAKQHLAAARAAYHNGRVDHAARLAAETTSILEGVTGTPNGEPIPPERLPQWAAEWPAELALYRRRTGELAAFRAELDRLAGVAAATDADPAPDFGAILDDGRWSAAVARARERLAAPEPDGTVDQAWQDARRAAFDEWLIGLVHRAADDGWLPDDEPEPEPAPAESAPALPTPPDPADDPREKEPRRDAEGVPEAKVLSDRFVDGDPEPVGYDADGAARLMRALDAAFDRLARRAWHTEAVAAAARAEVSAAGLEALNIALHGHRMNFAHEALALIGDTQQIMAARFAGGAPDERVGAFSDYAARLARLETLPPHVATAARDALAAQSALFVGRAERPARPSAPEDAAPAPEVPDEVAAPTDPIQALLSATIPDPSVEDGGGGGSDEEPPHPDPLPQPGEGESSQADEAVKEDAQKTVPPVADWTGVAEALTPIECFRTEIETFIVAYAADRFLDDNARAALADDHAEASWMERAEAALAVARGLDLADFFDERLRHYQEQSLAPDALEQKMRARIQRGPGESNPRRKRDFDAAYMALRLLRATSESDDVWAVAEDVRAGNETQDPAVAVRMPLVVRARFGVTVRLVYQHGWYGPADAPAHGMSVALLPVAAPFPPYEAPRFGWAPSLSEMAATGVLDGDARVPLLLELAPGDLDMRLVGTAFGYRLSIAHGPLLRKSVHALARAALELRAAGVDPRRRPRWELVEGPGAYMALWTPPGARVPAEALFAGRVFALEAYPPAGRDAVDAFLRAAEALADAVEADATIPRAVRTAFAPVLKGTYGPLDARDHLDGDFCRRLIEGDYLERHAPPLSPSVTAALAAYRDTLAQLEAGRPAFKFMLPDGRTVVALRGLEAELKQPTEGEEELNPATVSRGDRDPAPPYFWRIDDARGAETVFVEPHPERGAYGLQQATYWPGAHLDKPRETLPAHTAVSHLLDGSLASFHAGHGQADGDPAAWSAALARDWRGRDHLGPPGWGFPLHVVVQNDQGDVVALALPEGVLESPDFGPPPPDAWQERYADDPDHPWTKRRAAQDAWLDRVATLLHDPGAMSLLFTQFFRYSVDSPIAEQPTLLGNHLGAGDVHQTVHEVLDRKVMGRFLGDCDDLAEFFQVLATRQGRLAFVMSLPAHAACGWVDITDAEKEDDDEEEPARRYQFNVLQTGPALQFVADSLDAAVTAAYGHFDQGQGFSNFSVAAVPILLRFAGEQTRTPFVLEDRIYEDRPYAETMVRIQGYWHTHTYWRALREMIAMIETDRAIGNLKETASLYERVGYFKESEELRRAELKAGEDADRVVRVSTWLELATLYDKADDQPRFLDAVNHMYRLFADMRDDRDGAALQQTMQMRFLVTLPLVRRGYPLQALQLLGMDMNMAARNVARGIPLPRFFAIFFNRIFEEWRRRDALVGAERGDARENRPLDEKEREGRDALRKLLETGFRTAFFEKDDTWNDLLGKYAILADFRLARDGVARGLERLLADDGPAAQPDRDHVRRGADAEERDWGWFRLNPRLYLQLALKRLDERDYPRLYDPAMARRLFEALPAVSARVEAAGLSLAPLNDEFKRARLVLALLANDLDSFRAAMEEVRVRAWADSYDTAATTFGQYARLVPLEDFDAYCAVFRANVPDKQHHFKAAYRAFDNHDDAHARRLAQSALAAFPDDPYFVEEAKDFEAMLDEVARRREAAKAGAEAQPAAPAEDDDDDDASKERPAA